MKPLSKRPAPKKNSVGNEKRYRFFKGLFIFSAAVIVLCVIALFLLEGK